MARQLPPQPRHDEGAGRTDPAAEASRRWNRELKHSVSTAKATAKSVAENRDPGRPGTPKHPA